VPRQAHALPEKVALEKGFNSLLTLNVANQRVMAFQTYTFGLLKVVWPRHQIKSRVKVNNMLYPNVIKLVGGLHTSPELEKLADKHQ
jgi:hypothetical protein